MQIRKKGLSSIYAAAKLRIHWVMSVINFVGHKRKREATILKYQFTLSRLSLIRLTL